MKRAVAILSVVVAALACLAAPASARLLVEKDVPGMPGVRVMDDIALALRTGVTDADAVAMYDWIRGPSNQARGFASRAQSISMLATRDFATVSPLHLIYAKRQMVKETAHYLLPVSRFTVKVEPSLSGPNAPVLTFLPEIDPNRVQVTGPDTSSVCATAGKRQYCVFITGSGSETNALRTLPTQVFRDTPTHLVDGLSQASIDLVESGLLAYEIEILPGARPYAGAGGSRVINARFVRLVLFGNGIAILGSPTATGVSK